MGFLGSPAPARTGLQLGPCDKPSAGIAVEQVSHTFGRGNVLEGVTLRLTERRIAIIGSNGSGKSTFARLLNGLVVPTAGRVVVDGLDTSQKGRDVRRKVGFVFQNPDNQIVFPIVEEDVAFGLKNFRLSRPERDARVAAALARYDLSSLRQQPTHQLSGGQKQMLAITGALIMEPEYVIFDEPTTLLDLRNRRRVAQAIREMRQVAIVVSHDFELIRDFERVIVFEQGRVVIDDRPSVAIPRFEEMML